MKSPFSIQLQNVNVWNQNVKNLIVNVWLLVRHVILLVIVWDVIIQIVLNQLKNYRQVDVIARKQVAWKNIVNVI